jgi:hypothetical protein
MYVFTVRCVALRPRHMHETQQLTSPKGNSAVSTLWIPFLSDLVYNIPIAYVFRPWRMRSSKYGFEMTDSASLWWRIDLWTKCWQLDSRLVWPPVKLLSSGLFLQYFHELLKSRCGGSQLTKTWSSIWEIPACRSAIIMSRALPSAHHDCKFLDR